MKGKDLQKVMNLIGSKYVFNKTNYPNMDDTDRGPKLMFALQHSLLHMQKQLGVFATICEKYDHTGERTHQDQVKVEEAALKMFINTLKLAEELGYSAEGLLEEVEKFYENK